MQDFYYSLFIGVVGGLVATSLTVAFRNYWIKVLIPWYEERVYKDAKIEGVWKSAKVRTDQSKNVMLMNIRRVSHFVSGDITFIEGLDQGLTYKFTGEFRNLILTINYASINSSNIDRGTLTLMLIENGKKLKGYYSFYFDPENRINSLELVFNRQ